MNRIGLAVRNDITTRCVNENLITATVCIDLMKVLGKWIGQRSNISRLLLMIVVIYLVLVDVLLLLQSELLLLIGVLDSLLSRNF